MSSLMVARTGFVRCPPRLWLYESGGDTAVQTLYMTERFTRVDRGKLSIYYTLSTWNPYTIVMMRSEFRVSEGSSRRRSVRH